MVDTAGGWKSPPGPLINHWYHIIGFTALDHTGALEPNDKVLSGIICPFKLHCAAQNNIAQSLTCTESYLIGCWINLTVQSIFTKWHIVPLLIQTHNRIGESHLLGSVDVNVWPAPYVVVITFDRILAISSIQVCLLQFFHWRSLRQVKVYIVKWHLHWQGYVHIE